MIFNLLTIFLCVTLVYAEEIKPNSEKEHHHHKSEVLHNLLKSYDRLVRPGDGGQTVVVNVSMYIIHMKWAKNVLTLNLYLRQSWNDARLVQPQGKQALSLNAEDILSRIWKPDTFCTAVIDKQILEPGFIRITDGALVWSQLWKIKVPCRKSLGELYSKDGVITCSIPFESYGFGENDIKYKWKDSKPIAADEMALTNGVAFSLLNITHTETSHHLSTASYSRLTVELTMQTPFRKHIFDYLTLDHLQTSP